jgi:hypothetical protein
VKKVKLTTAFCASILALGLMQGAETQRAAPQAHTVREQ